MSGLFDGLDPQQRLALEQIVDDWIGEGLMTPPYPDAYYDIFEALGLATEALPTRQYDTRRPPGRPDTSDPEQRG